MFGGRQQFLCIYSSFFLGKRAIRAHVFLCPKGVEIARPQDECHILKQALINRGEGEFYPGRCLEAELHRCRGFGIARVLVLFGCHKFAARNQRDLFDIV